MGVKYLVNKDFFKKWSREMAYLLGYLYADGSMEDASYLRGKYVRASSIDKELIDFVKYFLQAEHPIVKLQSRNKRDSLKYFIRIGDKDLYESLIKLGLSPNKSLVMIFPKVPKKYLNDFIRGYFDGDGCVFLERSKGKIKEKIIKKLNIIFTSGSKDFLIGLKEEIERNYRILNLKIYNNRNAFQLKSNTHDSIEIFKKIYWPIGQPFLERKKDSFAEYFKLRPGRVDERVKKVLLYRRFGTVAKQ